MSTEYLQQQDELDIVNLDRVKRISETFRSTKSKKKGSIPRSIVEEIWKCRLSPRFFLRLMNVMFPEDSKEVSFLSFYTIYKNLAEPETEIMFRALTIYHIATIHEPPFNYELANEYPNASYKCIKDYVCDVFTSYLHAVIHIHMKEALAWLDLRASNTLIDGNLVATYVLKDLESHRNEVSIGSLEIWLEKNEMYYTVSEQLYLFLFGVNKSIDVKPLLPFPEVQSGKGSRTLLAMPDVLLLNSKLPKRAQRWSLAYIMDSRSDDWETFKQAIYGKRQTIIVIQDANGDIFGMYGSQQWIPAEGFYGNDESFLFTLRPEVNVYDSSGRDNHYQIFTESGIGMGGTEDQMGLYINCSLKEGSTSLACSTFREYWPLATNLKFKIRQLEVWTTEEVNDALYGSLDDETQALPVLKDTYLLSEGEVAKVHAEEIRDQQQEEAKNFNSYQGKTCSCRVRACRARTKLSCSGQRGKCARSCCAMRCAKRSSNKHQTEASCSMASRGEGDRNKDKIVKKVQSQRKYCDEGLTKRQVYCPIRSCRNHQREDARFIKEEMQKQKSGGWVHPSLSKEENEKRRAGETPTHLPPKKKVLKEESSHHDDCQCNASDKSVTQMNSARSTNIVQKNASNNELLFGSEAGEQIESENKVDLIDEILQVSESKLLPVPECYCRGTRGESPCNCPPLSTGNINPGSFSRHQCQSQYLSESGSCKTSQACSVPSSKHRGCQMRTLNGILRANTCRLGSPIVLQKAEHLHVTPPASHNVIVGRQEILITGPTGKSVTNQNIAKEITHSKSLASIKPNIATREIVINRDTIQKSVKVQESDGERTTTTESDKNCNNSNDVLVFAESRVTVRSSLSTRSYQSNFWGEEQDSTRAESSFLECHCSSSTISCSDLDNEPETIENMRVKFKCHCDTIPNLNLVDQTASLPDSLKCMCFLKNPTEGNQSTKSLVATEESAQLRQEMPFKLQLTPKETPSLLKSRHSSTLGSQLLKYLNLTAPPTCLSCKSKVESNGCQCAHSSKSSKVKRVPDLEQSSRLLQRDPQAPKRMSILKPSAGLPQKSLKRRKSSVVINLDLENFSYKSSGSLMLVPSTTGIGMNDSNNTILRANSRAESTPSEQPRASCRCSLNRTHFPQFPEDGLSDDRCLDCDCASNDLKFPTFVETPPEKTSEKDSEENPLLTSEAEVDDKEEEDKPCPCDEGTIMILNVPKCNAKETVQKLIQELECRQTDPNMKSLAIMVPGCVGAFPGGGNKASQKLYSSKSARVQKSGQDASKEKQIDISQ